MRRVLILFIITLLASGLLTLLLWRLRATLSMPRAKSPESPSPWLLLLLPSPAALAAIIALAQGQLLALVGDLVGYGLLMSGALAMRRGLAGAVDRPWKLIGIGLTGLGAGVTAGLGAGHTIGVAVAFGLLASIGAGLCYGLDPQLAQLHIRGLGGGRHARAMLRRAQHCVGRLERASREIREPELAGRLQRIITLAREILARLQDDPRDLHRARRFLTVYLEGIQHIVDAYVKTRAQVDSPQLDQRFHQALIRIEEAFCGKRQTLLQADVEEIDVQIEVLTQQLEHEGML